MVIFLTAIVEGELTKSIHPKQKKAMKTESMSNVPFSFLALSHMLANSNPAMAGKLIGETDPAMAGKLVGRNRSCDGRICEPPIITCHFGLRTPGGPPADQDLCRSSDMNTLFGSST